MVNAFISMVDCIALCNSRAQELAATIKSDQTKIGKLAKDMGIRVE